MYRLRAVVPWQASKLDVHFHLPPAFWHKTDECASLGFYLALVSAITERPCKERVGRSGRRGRLTWHG
jgi:hypothetical protein